MKKVLKLTITDLRLIFREPSLRIFLAMPFSIILVTNVLMPYLVAQYPVVSDYVAFVIIAATVQTSTMMGFIYAMVFVDEKDIQVARMYGVLPINQSGFLWMRLSIPLLMAWAISVIILIVQPFYIVQPWDNIFLSLAAGMVAPMMCLSVVVLSKNKMEAMTWYKLVNIFVTLPLLAFFLDSYQFVLGFLPTFWIYQSAYIVMMGGVLSWMLPVGLSFEVLLLWWLTRKFIQVQFI